MNTAVCLYIMCGWELKQISLSCITKVTYIFALMHREMLKKNCNSIVFGIWVVQAHRNEL